jgi:competence protein ComGC
MSLEELAKSQNLVLQITSSLLLIIFSIGWGTFLMAFTYRNFLWLKKQKLNKVFNPAEARGKYKALAIWGGVAIVAMIILPVVILTAINPGNQMAKSRDSFKKNTIQMIGRGAELYRTEKGVYPESIEQMIEGKYIRLNTDSNSSDLVYQSDGTTYEVCGQTELDGKYCYSPNNTFPLKQDVIE